MIYPEFLTPFVFPHEIPVLGMIRWYGLMYLIGILLWFFLMKRKINKGELNMSIEDKGGLYDLTFAVLLGIIIGARLGYFIFYSPETFINAPLEVLGMHFNAEGGFSHFGFMGMSYHGGMLGVVVGIVLYARKNGFKFWDLTDNIILPAPLGLFFGRLGNFINAELYGKVSESFPLAIRFPKYGSFGGHLNWLRAFITCQNQNPKPEECVDIFYTLPRHPSQLYEALLEGLALFGLMLIADKIKKSMPHLKPGIVVWTFIGGYGLFRTLVEFVRDHTTNSWQIFGWLTAGMAYSIPMFIISAAMIGYIFITSKKKTPEIS